MKSRQYSCVTPEGKFIYGIHKPSYRVTNLRVQEKIESLGFVDDGTEISNHINFPTSDIDVKKANWIYEIPNPLPFRGTTYIEKNWADNSIGDPSRMQLPQRKPLSFSGLLQDKGIDGDFISSLPRPVLLTLATCSTDRFDLVPIAEMSCSFIKDDEGNVTGLGYRKREGGGVTAAITDHDLFEAVANNPFLPDDYKRAMVLRPGAQGTSKIVGEWLSGNSHIYEYLRRNSYISGGHFAANMADDAVRYGVDTLSEEDMQGLRHLYYQRMYVRFAEKLSIDVSRRTLLSDGELEQLRLKVLEKIRQLGIENLSTLWGWNFGFDYSPSDYRLHASHQQIHQQFAQVPEFVDLHDGDPQQQIGDMMSFSCGDMVAEVIDIYAEIHNSHFFEDYYAALTSNSRMDGRNDLPSSLIVWEDDSVLLFVPKAQTSQWELQIMTKANDEGFFCGNILEADTTCRQSLNTALLKAQRIFEKLGARMVTSIEFSKRINELHRQNQPLIYSLLPKLPFSMGAFSEAQLRFINGHYPEDFAHTCRNQQ